MKYMQFKYEQSVLCRQTPSVIGLLELRRCCISAVGSWKTISS